MVPVPFNGAGPAVASVLGGHTPIGFATLASALSQIEGEKLRALAVTSKSRASQLKSVPTTGESGYPDIVGDIWVGLMAPAGTAKPIIEQLHKQTVAVISEPDTKERLAKVGFETVGTTPEQFRQQIASELESWRKLIEAAKVKQQ